MKRFRKLFKAKPEIDESGVIPITNFISYTQRGEAIPDIKTVKAELENFDDDGNPIEKETKKC